MSYRLAMLTRRPPRPLLIVGLTLLLVAGVGMTIRAVMATNGSVYSVEQVVESAARHPQVWRGRTVLVRGAIVWYSYASPPIVQRMPRAGVGTTSTYVPIFGQVGCFGAAHACRHTISTHLATVPAGYVIYAALAPQFHRINAVMLPQGMVRYPPGTLTVAFRMPPASGPAASVQSWIHRVPLLGRYIPGSSLNALPASGIYRLTLFMYTHPSRPRRGFRYDALLADG